MANFRVLSPEYEEMKTTLAGDVSHGAFVASGETDGFYMVDGLTGEEATIITRAKKVQTNIKAAGQAWTVGQALYYESATPTVTNVAAGNSLIGYAIQAAAAADTTGYLNFDGKARFLKL